MPSDDAAGEGPPGAHPPSASAAALPWLDVGAAWAVVAVGLAAAVALPEGSRVRLVAAAPAVLWAPGYLLLQAILVPARPARRRALHAALAFGVGPPVAGLLAFSTSLVPGGFRPPAILFAVGLGCLGLGWVAMRRRATAWRAAGQAAGGMPRAARMV